MDEKLTLVVDGNNLIFRAYHSHKVRTENGWEPLKTSDGRVSSGVFGGMQTLRSLVRNFRPDYMLWTFDSGRSDKRMALHDNYKGDRGEKSEDISYQFSAFDELLSILNVSRYSIRNVEADDLIASAVHQFDGHKVIVSGDHDLRQLVGDQTMVYRPSLGQKSAVLYDEEKIVEEYGLKPKQLPEVWAVCGDSSDNINGVPRYGFKTAKKSYLKYGGFREMVHGDPKLREHEDLIFRNYRLINLDHETGKLPHSQSDIYFDKSYDEKALINFLTEWEFESVKKRLAEGKDFWE